jgi:hypothetical protein
MTGQHLRLYALLMVALSFVAFAVWRHMKS